MHQCFKFWIKFGVFFCSDFMFSIVCMGTQHAHLQPEHVCVDGVCPLGWPSLADVISCQRCSSWKVTETSVVSRPSSQLGCVTSSHRSQKWEVLGVEQSLDQSAEAEVLTVAVQRCSTGISFDPNCQLFISGFNASPCFHCNFYTVTVHVVSTQWHNSLKSGQNRLGTS